MTDYTEWYREQTVAFCRKALKRRRQLRDRIDRGDLRFVEPDAHKMVYDRNLDGIACLEAKLAEAERDR